LDVFRVGGKNQAWAKPKDRFLLPNTGAIIGDAPIESKPAVASHFCSSLHAPVCGKIYLRISGYASAYVETSI
jgi:hypothetical protein